MRSSAPGDIIRVQLGGRFRGQSIVGRILEEDLRECWWIEVIEGPFPVGRVISFDRNVCDPEEHEQKRLI